MEWALGKTAWLVVAVIALAGCKPQPEAAARQDKNQHQLELMPLPKPLSPREGKVRVSGDDALSGVLSWSLPKVKIENPSRARAQARKALAHGDLFETEHSAIPILLALQAAAPGNTQDAKLLAEAQAALLSQAWIALSVDDDVASLQFAQRHGTVLRTLWPDLPEVKDYQAAVDRVGRAFELTQQGQRALQAGRLDGAGSALDYFRKALAVWPEQVHAQAGVAEVEARLIAAAFTEARKGEFDRAYVEIARARRAERNAALITAATQRIETMRDDRIRRLGDEGLMALGDEDLDFARVRLAEMLRIAKPGNQKSIELRQRIDLVSHYGLFRPGQVFTDALPDGSRGPSLRVLSMGSFMMGAEEGEPGASADEQPQHPIRFERGFAMGRFEITVGQFRRFIEATGYVPRATQRGHSLAYDARSGNFVRGSGIDWRSSYDGRPAGDTMPVIHVTAYDAEAYAAWLSEQTGAHYRLPSEAEFEYALRAGGTGLYPWGNSGPPEDVENLAGGRDVSPQKRHWNNAFPGYGDGWWGPAPVGSFMANAFGLHDMGGNVSEWVTDCWHKGYRRAPSNGAAWVNPGCRTRMYRGGAWSSAPAQVRSAWRMAGGVDITSARVGFRLVRQL